MMVFHKATTTGHRKRIFRAYKRGDQGTVYLNWNKNEIYTF